MSEITFKDAEQAKQWLARYEEAVREISRWTKARLVNAHIAAGGLMGRADYMRWSKDQLVDAVVEDRFPPERIALAMHYRYQASGVQCSDACPHHEVADDFPHPTAEEHAIAQVAERLDRFCADLEEQGMTVTRDGFSVRIDVPGRAQVVEILGT